MSGIFVFVSEGGLGRATQADILIKLNKGIGPGRYIDKIKHGYWPS